VFKEDLLIRALMPTWISTAMMLHEVPEEFFRQGEVVILASPFDVNQVVAIQRSCQFLSCVSTMLLLVELFCLTIQLTLSMSISGLPLPFASIVTHRI